MNAETEPPQTDLTDEQRRLRAAAFWAIFDGTQAALALLAERTSLPLENVRAVLDALEERGAITRDDRGIVTGSHGLSAVPAAYALVLDGRARWVWCAEDAVGIPAALEMDAEASGACAVCGGPIVLRVRGGRPDDQPARVWLTSAEAGTRTVETR